MLAILGENVQVGGFLFSSGTFQSFWAKMYRLGVSDSQPVHFGHFGRKCTGLGFFVLSRYIFGILAENVLAEGFLVSAGALWPFWAKM